MGMYQNFLDIMNVIYNDEDLLRLLYYPPANLGTDTLDPLDPCLPNIKDMEVKTKWNIINERVMLTPKTDDLDSKAICRILIYAGRRRPNSGNYLMAHQHFVVDIVCHFSFENGDIRSTRISDRLNELLALQHITGIGKMDYYDGNQLSSPKEYVGYRHIYEFGSTKS
ncbi:hypothetical protein COE51_16390 [Bacillus pseudomycoides]|nr:hypothetical protein COE51_16390 [Bacillus pseudomycoides]